MNISPIGNTSHERFLFLKEEENRNPIGTKRRIFKTMFKTLFAEKATKASLYEEKIEKLTD